MKDKLLINEIMNWCFDNNIEYMPDLMSYAEKNRSDWYMLLDRVRGYVLMTRYLRAHSER